MLRAYSEITSRLYIRSPLSPICAHEIRNVISINKVMFVIRMRIPYPLHSIAFVCKSFFAGLFYRTSFLLPLTLSAIVRKNSTEQFIIIDRSRFHVGVVKSTI